jgi:hypothetical protein
MAVQNISEGAKYRPSVAIDFMQKPCTIFEKNEISLIIKGFEYPARQMACCRRWEKNAALPGFPADPAPTFYRGLTPH